MSTIPVRFTRAHQPADADDDGHVHHRNERRQPGEHNRLGNDNINVIQAAFEDRDAFIASGMDDGVREGYERLDELLAG